MEALIVLLGLTVFGYAVFTSIDATGLLLKPDFESSWYDMTAQAGNHTTLLSIAHGLGVAPLLVDVQVLVPSGGNKGYIFPGSGCRVRDDDQPEAYGGIIYIYNDVYVKVSSPMKANDNLGRCIYTGQSPYWEGPYSTDTFTAKVRVRAWKKSTLPPVDFSEGGILISCGSSSVSYVERSHGLGDYPALVISRTKFPPSSTKTYPNYYSDSVGASMGMSDGTSNQNSFVVYGFSKNTIRAWAPTASSDHVFAGDDGWNFDTVDSGELEFYAWKQSSLTPNITGTLTLGQSVVGSSLKANFSYIGNTTATYTKAWVQASSGSNSGFRFVGNGNLAYDETALAAGCSFGGFLYAYHDNSIRFWQPGPGSGSSNGALICIADKMGGGQNVQASSGGVAVYYSWTLDTDDCTFLHCLNGGTCTNYAGGYTCTCVAGYEGINCQTAFNNTTEATSTGIPSINTSKTGSASMTTTTTTLANTLPYSTSYSTTASTSTTTESSTSSTSSIVPSITFTSPTESSTSSASSQQPSTTTASSRHSPSTTSASSRNPPSTTSALSTQPSNLTVSTRESSTKSNSSTTTPPTTSTLSTQPSTTYTVSTEPPTKSAPASTPSSPTILNTFTDTTVSSPASSEFTSDASTTPVPALNETTEATSTGISSIDTSATGSASMTTTTTALTNTLPFSTSYSTAVSTSTTTDSSTSFTSSAEPSTLFTSPTESSTSSTSSQQPSTTSASSRHPPSSTSSSSRHPPSTNSTLSTQPSNVTMSTRESSTKPNSATTTRPTTSVLSTQPSFMTASTRESSTKFNSTTTTPPTTSTLSTQPSTTYTASTELPSTSTPASTSSSPTTLETSANTTVLSPTSSVFTSDAPTTPVLTLNDTIEATSTEMSSTDTPTSDSAPMTTTTSTPSPPGDLNTSTNPTVSSTTSLVFTSDAPTTPVLALNDTIEATSTGMSSTDTPTSDSAPMTTTTSTPSPPGDLNTSTNPTVSSTTSLVFTSDAPTTPVLALNDTIEATSTEMSSTDTPTSDSAPMTTTTSTPSPPGDLNTSTNPTVSSTTSLVFTSDAPTTPVLDCGNPPFLDLGWRQFNGTSPGSVAKYFCRPGYDISGTYSIVCQKNGTWDTLDAVCLPVDCGPLNVSTDGSITYIPTSTTHFGSVATFECRPGFLIFDTNQRATFFCSENGIWEGNFSLVCIQVFCKELAAPSNGMISRSDNSIGSVVIYNCSDGYTLDGYRSRVCLSSGIWSGIDPLCKQTPTKQAEPCPENKDYRDLLWHETEPGQIDTESCSEQNNNLTGEITRKCTETGEWLLPHYNCVRRELEQIQEAVNTIKDKPTAAAVDDVLNQLSSLTDQQAESTYSGEIKVVTSTLEVIANIDYTNITLTQDQNEVFLETTSNLLDLSNAESWQAIDEQSAETGESSGASKVLDVVSTYTDAIANSLDESEENRTINVSNLVLQVRRLNNSKDVTFPSTDDFPNISTALSLSQTSLQGSTTYSAVVYKNLTGVLSTNASFGSQNLELGSSVMSVKLDQWEKVDDFKITITFQHFQTRRQIATCSYRNESRNVWEKGGCRVKHSNSAETVCECDHLTNFAILMSPWTESNVDTEAIRIISIVGCSVSILCLIVTMISHLWYWKYVKSDRVKILMNLCIAMIVSYGIFLGGVDRTSNKDACTTVAVLLQYIYLVVFFLMLAEGIEISVIVLYVFTTKSRLKWILPSAWLLPALVVGISLAVTQTKGYGNSKACWLSIDNGLIWAFIGPALLIILVNFILIVLVMKAIFKTKKLSQKSNKERTITGLRCLCVLLPLVGCTWVIGIFYVNEDMAWIQYVFAICNGLQGMAIFIFHCALNTQIRNAYKRKHKYSQSASATRSTSNPLLIPRPTASLSSTESNVYFNISFTEATHQRRRHIHGGHEYRIKENLEMKYQPYTLNNFDNC